MANELGSSKDILLKLIQTVLLIKSTEKFCMQINVKEPWNDSNDSDESCWWNDDSQNSAFDFYKGNLPVFCRGAIVYSVPDLVSTLK